MAKASRLGLIPLHLGTRHYHFERIAFALTPWSFSDKVKDNGSLNKLKQMARLEGFEPPTYRFVACCSIQLSHRRACVGREL